MKRIFNRKNAVLRSNTVIATIPFKRCSYETYGATENSDANFRIIKPDADISDTKNSPTAFDWAKFEDLRVDQSIDNNQQSAKASEFAGRISLGSALDINDSGAAEQIVYANESRAVEIIDGKLQKLNANPSKSALDYTTVADQTRSQTIISSASSADENDRKSSFPPYLQNDASSFVGGFHVIVGELQEYP